MTGADTPEGPGWWKASDDKWYPPSLQSPSAETSPASPDGPGFLGRLFDLSISTFITPSIVKLLFVLGIILISLTALGLLIAGAQESAAWIVIAPIFWLFSVVYLRVILELILVLFRIEANTRESR